MSKINNKSMNFGFKLLTILAFGLFLVPATASAEGGVNYIFGTERARPERRVSQPAYNQVYQSPVYAVQAPATPTVYSYSTNPARTGTSGTSTRTSTSRNTNVNSNTNADSARDDEPENGSDLAASAIYGSNGFLPSGIIQWLLVAIFVLLIIIIARRTFGAREAYDASPLKHA